MPRSPLFLAVFVMATSIHLVAEEIHPPQPTNPLYNGIELPSPRPQKGSFDRDPLAPPPYLAAPPAVIPIDVGRQLFVDDFLIAETTLTRTYHLPEYYPGNPVFAPSEPWESGHAAPFSDGVWFDGKDHLYKMWYWAGGTVNGDTRASTCFATSTDGIHWDRPKLDVVPGTNIVALDTPEQVRNSSTVWLDAAERDPARRFKMFRVVRSEAKEGAPTPWHIHVGFSPDGIHWTDAGDSDRCNDRTTVFYNAFRGVWVASLRFSGGFKERTRAYYESPDVLGILHWLTPDRQRKDVNWIGADKLDPDRGDLELRHPLNLPFPEMPSQLYNLDCVAYESVMLGLFSIWRGQQVTPLPKINEVCVGYSRDGFHWSRPDRRAFCPVRANENAWNSGNLQSAGGCCLVVGDQLRFYVGAVPKGKSFADPGNVGLATLRRDGFASLDAGATGGTLLTRPVRFQGRQMFVNVDCPQGELRVEIVDEAGKIIAPFSAENCEPLRVDKSLQRVRWKGAENLDAVRGKSVRFRFHLTNGKLYAFWTSSDPAGASGGFVGAGGPGFAGNVDLPMSAR
jgi:hypothetical protein